MSQYMLLSVYIYIVIVFKYVYFEWLANILLYEDQYISLGCIFSFPWFYSFLDFTHILRCKIVFNRGFTVINDLPFEA